MRAGINWPGLAGGVAVILLVVISLFVPWWQLTVGEDLVKANVSPIYTNFDFIGSSFTIPLLLALNVSSIILMTAGGVAVLIYSVKPTTIYSKQLLSFGYRKPLYALIFFIIGLYATTVVVKSVFGFDVPLIGSAIVTMPTEMTQGAMVSVPMVAGFQWPFWLAVAASVLCIAARLFHPKIVPIKGPVVNSTSTALASPAPTAA